MYGQTEVGVVDTWDHWGAPLWEMVGCLALSAAVLGTYESYTPPHNITTVKPGQ